MDEVLAVTQEDRDAAVRAIPAAVIFADEEEHVADLRERAAAIFARHRLAAREEAQNPCAGIFDHKWLDMACVANGCQSLLLKSLMDACAKLVFAARTGGGTAGMDEELCRACETVETQLTAIRSLKE